MSGVEHPDVPGWWGERSWTAPGEPPSDFVVWAATDAGAPFAIAHAREVMMDAGELLQDYNYLTYAFGDPARPIVARHYLGDREVGVALPGDPPRDAHTAAATLPPEVLAWLRQRFEGVTVLTQAGYKAIWRATGADAQADVQLSDGGRHG